MDPGIFEGLFYHMGLGNGMFSPCVYVHIVFGHMYSNSFFICATNLCILYINLLCIVTCMLHLDIKGKHYKNIVSIIASIGLINPFKLKNIN